MAEYHEIRALYDADTITVYQAYSNMIGKPAAKNNRFVEPFSYNRMTWIKPSFLWMMERSGWGQKAGQECVLAVRIRRDYFEKALAEAVLSSPQRGLYENADKWSEKIKESRIRVQWDPERDIRGNKLEYRSIQIGISRHLIREYNEEWIVGIEDISQLVAKILELKKDGRYDKAKRFLPTEKVYPVSAEICRTLGMKL